MLGDNEPIYLACAARLRGKRLLPRIFLAQQRWIGLSFFLQNYGSNDFARLHARNYGMSVRCNMQL